MSFVRDFPTMDWEASNLNSLPLFINEQWVCLMSFAFVKNQGIFH